MILTHTFVPPEQRGRSLAERLVRRTLNDAKAQSLKVVPACSDAAAFIRRHPEYPPPVAVRQGGLSKLFPGLGHSETRNERGAFAAEANDTCGRGALTPQNVVQPATSKRGEGTPPTSISTQSSWYREPFFSFSSCAPASIRQSPSSR